MAEQENKAVKILDWLILSFFVIFILSLSNSIFVNQIGYFGALLFILVKIALTRKNQFHKTGLEIAFALYMIAEILALIFSDYKAEALNNFTKRALLIPVFYTTITATTNLKRGKNFFYLFITASLITGIVYLIVAVNHYLNNQYVITQSGPALIQNPITTSEIFSFTVLFLFAFILNEKTNWKTNILLYSGFAISVLALLATYKRTGWMGVAFSIVLLLIIKKKWKILIPLFILGLVLLLTDKNVSLVSVYNFADNHAEKIYTFNTDGRAVSIDTADSLYIINDYENGILFYKDTTLLKRIETPTPVTAFRELNGKLYLAQLVDTRFLIYRKEGKRFKQVNELLPPGQTKDFIYRDEILYTLDSDSGLTLYQSLEHNTKETRLPIVKDCKWMFIDSSYFYFVSNRSGIDIFTNTGTLPGELVAKIEMGEIDKAYLFDGFILLAQTDGLKVFKLEKNQLVQKEILSDLKQVHKISQDGEILAVLTGDGTVYKIKLDSDSKPQILAKAVISPKPTNFTFENNKLYCAYVYRSRLLSFFDMNLQVNFTRLALWRAGWEIWKDHPLFGVGDIDLAKYYLKYKRPYDKEIHGHLHNNYFHFLATLGLFGFLALMYLFFKIFKKIAGIYSSVKGKPFIASYSLGTIASVASILVAGLSELNFWDQEIATLIYFTVGLNFALYIHFKKEKDDSNEEQQ